MSRLGFGAGRGYKHSELRLNDQTVAQLVIATSGATRRRGLLKLESVPQDTALLIRNCNNIHMVGMRFPIDVVFVTGAGRVAKVCPNVKPGLRLRGTFRARHTIELAAGDAQRLGLAPGASVSW